MGQRDQARPGGWAGGLPRQRCSVLRVLGLQEEVADRTLRMLKGALAELSVGNPDRLSTDIGPVISEEARGGILAHVEAMRTARRPVYQTPQRPGQEHGTFVPPTIMEIGNLSDLKDEVFGPVLHGLPFPRGGLDALVNAVDGTGFGLTFGIDSRIDETMARVTARDGAGNVCVNRDLIGAVVGAQPFGGHGLSGTGQGGWAALPPPSPVACSFLDRPSCRPHSSGFCRLGGPNGIDRSPRPAGQEYTGWRVSCSGGARRGREPVPH